MDTGLLSLCTLVYPCLHSPTPLYAKHPKKPLHYASAYGAKGDVFKTLANAYPDALITMDDKGRTPFLFCMANVDRPYAPIAVRFMLTKHTDLVNRYRSGYSPLHALADRAAHIEDPDGRENAGKCLELYMNAEPIPTADLISALQQLPDWLLEDAVNLEVVQNLLNQKISQPFPTAILMLDFYFLIMVVVTFSSLVIESIQRRFDDDPTNDAIGGARVAPLYLASVYFLTREMIQFLGVSSLGATSTYFTDATNVLDVAFITLIAYFSYQMHTGRGDRESFRTWTAVVVGVMWANILVYLKNVIIDLAIFIAGVIYVLKRLGAFVLATAITLVAFTQIFATLFQQTPFCRGEVKTKDLNAIRCGSDDDFQYCDLWDTFLRVYTMMLGEVEGNDFAGSRMALVCFIVFFFLVVILMANVLIAIVADSYSVVRNERAAIVFWTNRLDFVAEMDAIAHSPLATFVRHLFCGENDDEKEHQTTERSTFGYESWLRLLRLFDEDEDEPPWFTYPGFSLFVIRLLVAFVVLPCWVAAGVMTVGILWPPQIREFVFIEAIATKIGASDDFEVEQDRSLKLKTIQEEMKETQFDISQELLTDRTHVAHVKTQLNELKAELTTEARALKKAMAQFIEEQARQANR